MRLCATTFACGARTRGLTSIVAPQAGRQVPAQAQLVLCVWCLCLTEAPLERIVAPGDLGHQLTLSLHPAHGR